MYNVNLRDTGMKGKVNVAPFCYVKKRKTVADIKAKNALFSGITITSKTSKEIDS